MEENSFLVPIIYHPHMLIRLSCLKTINILAQVYLSSIIEILISMEYSHPFCYVRILVFYF